MEHQERIRIAGEWSISTVTERISTLSERLGQIREDETRGFSRCGRRTLIDLEEVEEIDLSGWQLLAFWFRHVRGLGFDPALVNVREELQCRMDLLGFAREFTSVGTEVKKG